MVYSRDKFCISMPIYGQIGHTVAEVSQFGGVASEM